MSGERGRHWATDLRPSNSYYSHIRVLWPWYHCQPCILYLSTSPAPTCIYYGSNIIKCIYRNIVNQKSLLVGLYYDFIVYQGLLGFTIGWLGYRYTFDTFDFYMSGLLLRNSQFLGPSLDTLFCPLFILSDTTPGVLCFCIRYMEAGDISPVSLPSCAKSKCCGWMHVTQQYVHNIMCWNIYLHIYTASLVLFVWLPPLHPHLS